MRRLLLFATALSLAACATVPPGAMDADTGAPSKSEASFAVAEAAARVADAIGQAPPVTLAATTIDEKAIRAAFVTFDHALDLIDAAVAGGVIHRGTPTALTIRRVVVTTQAALNAASAAQRAGNATSYTAALHDAESALASLRIALAR